MIGEAVKNDLSALNTQKNIQKCKKLKEHLIATQLIQRYREIWCL